MQNPSNATEIELQKVFKAQKTQEATKNWHGSVSEYFQLWKLADNCSTHDGSIIVGKNIFYAEFAPYKNLFQLKDYRKEDVFFKTWIEVKTEFSCSNEFEPEYVEIPVLVTFYTEKESEEDDYGKVHTYTAVTIAKVTDWQGKEIDSQIYDEQEIRKEIDTLIEMFHEICEIPYDLQDDDYIDFD